jgi:hypothetical protein
MPGVRSEGQIMIGCWCDVALVEKIDRARHSLTRSQFCREAIGERLRALGIDVSEREMASPDRVGKGGAKRNPRVKYTVARHPAEFNEPGSAPGAGSPKRPPRK